jgi:hypothetical protein
MPKVTRERIEAMERKQFEAEWSQALSDFPQLSPHELGSTLASLRRVFQMPPAALNPEELSRTPGRIPELIKIIHAMAPGIAFYNLRFGLRMHELAKMPSERAQDQAFKEASDELDRSAKLLGLR